LAEDQKQLTLLKMVEDANRLSGAMGQAARESDTWGNQLGNLKQGLTDLKATVGRSFLQPAIQVLKLVALLISTLTEGIKGLTAEGKFLNRMFERMTNRIKKAQDFVERFVRFVGGAERAVKLLALVAGSLFAAMNAGKILKFVKSLGTGLGGINKKMLMIAAVIVIVALLIEDLISFMNGNDSLMGGLFKKFGIDGEQVKETIRGILDGAKALLPFILDLAKQFGGKLVKALKQLLPLLVQLLKKIIPPLVSFIKRLVPLLMEIGKKVLALIFSSIERIIPLLTSIIEKILPFVIGLVERLLPFILQIAETVLPAIFQVIESLLPLLFQIVEAVLPVVLSLIEAILPLILQVVDTVLPLIISLIETLLPMIMQIIEAVLPVVIALLTAVLPLLVQIVEAILPIILTLIEAILPLVFQIIEAILPAILELITAILPILTPIVELVASLVGSLLPPILGLLDAILPILKPILGVLKPIADVLGVIIGIVGKIVEWVGKGFSWIVGLFTGGGGDVNITTDASGNPVEQNARGTSNSADTFIAGEEGPELITGARGRKVFTSAETGNIFQTLKDIATLGLTPQPETVASSVSSVENKSVVQNNQFTNQFYGDRAIQQKSAAAIERSADDATGILSRGLAYAR
jgi:phage-related protein